ncbi:MAG: hypothetical protein IPI28_03350 [Candidatus Omnitrophica bacterium]|nr:hypothetical protein [Candidatus Omnitrophota bacterium]
MDPVHREGPLAPLAGRRSGILDYVRKVRDEVKKVSPKTLIGLCHSPGVRMNTTQALYRIAGQDLAGFGKIKVDALSPMLYFRERSAGRRAGWPRESVNRLAGGCAGAAHCEVFRSAGPLPDGDLTSGIDQGQRPPRGE